LIFDLLTEEYPHQDFLLVDISHKNLVASIPARLLYKFVGKKEAFTVRHSNDYGKGDISLINFSFASDDAYQVDLLADTSGINMAATDDDLLEESVVGKQEADDKPKLSIISSVNQELNLDDYDDDNSTLRFILGNDDDGSSSSNALSGDDGKPSSGSREQSTCSDEFFSGYSIDRPPPLVFVVLAAQGSNLASGDAPGSGAMLGLNFSPLKLCIIRVTYSNYEKLFAGFAVIAWIVQIRNNIQINL
jgi:hypothetical protein